MLRQPLSQSSGQSSSRFVGGLESILPAERRGIALTISLATAGLMAIAGVIAVAAYYLEAGPLGGIWLTALGLAAALFSVWLCWRGRVTAGIVFLTVAIMAATLPFLSTLIVGQSISMALIIVMFVIGTSISTLPRPWLRIVTTLAVLQGLGYVFYDYYLYTGLVNQNFGAVLVIFVVLLLVYSYLNRRLIQSSGFRFRMVLAFLIVALLPLLVLSWMNSQRLADLSTERADQDLTNLANQVGQALDNFVQTQMDALRTESRNPVMPAYFSNPSANAADAASALRSLSLKNPVFITSYAILDRSGANLLDTNPNNVGRSEGDRQYAQTPLASGRPYVSNVMFYEGQPRLYFSSPIRNPAGELLGLLRVEYNAAVLQWLVKNNSSGASAERYVVVMDEENYLRLAQSNDPRQLYQSYASLSSDQVTTLQKYGRLPPGPVEQFSANQAAVVDGLRNIAVEPFFTASASALGGEAAYSTAIHITRAPWIVMTRTSVSSIQAEVNGQTRGAVLLALISGIFVILAALGVGQLLATPIVRLTRIAEQVAAGNLDVRSEETTQDEIGGLARTFNAMTAQLKDTLEGLEQRVADRTRALDLSSDVSRRLSTLLDPAQLVSQVVDLLQETFEYYHVHIYLWDQDQENLVMVGGTGEAGKIMLERGHSLPRGRGLVGQACETSTVVLVPDTRSDPTWLPNPLLPETRSELAAPILLGDEVLGALDVQQDRVNGLSQQDVDVINSVASQLAIALQNARRYQQTQTLAQRESLVATIIDQIQRTRTVDEALQVTTRELGRAIHAPRVGARIQLDSDRSGYDGRSKVE